MSDALFFGCWNQPGHYLFGTDGDSLRPSKVWREDVERVDGVHLDGNYAPRRHRRTDRICWGAQGATDEERCRVTCDSGEVEQGRFLRHERGGWTLIQWWDRNQGDRRGACNSTFLLRGSHDSATMLARLRESFPHVVANLDRVGVELVEVHP